MLYVIYDILLKVALNINNMSVLMYNMEANFIDI
jgi:hypothetical protein